MPDDQAPVKDGVKIGANDRGTVPKEALLLSLLSLWVPVLSSAVFPDWTTQDVGVLVWLLAFVPGFLLSYYRGWKGASLALAAGMAALSVAQAFIVITDAPVPPVEVLLGIVLVLTAVSLGSGILSSFFHRSLAHAERMALTDQATGIPNRRHAVVELEKAFAAAQRGSDLSVVIFDLDHFKRINDEFGHSVGDMVLVEFAGLLRSAGRTMNVIARYGGEEFIAILRGEKADGALIFADRIRIALKELDVPGAPITTSGGIAQYEEGMASPDVLVAAADQALYRAKRGGRDQIAILGEQGKLDREDTGVPERGHRVARGKGELILVVDDDLDALHSVSRFLRRSGYTVLESPSPPRAIEIVRGLTEPVDLVLTDIVMPEMGGFQLVERLLEIQGYIPAIYMSGYTQQETDWAGVPGSASDYLTKPISVYTLSQRIRAILDRTAEVRPRAGSPAQTRIGEGEKPASDPPTRPPPPKPEASEEEQERNEAALAGSGFVGSGGRILLVMADPDDADGAATVLRKSGLSPVEVVTEGATAVDLLPSAKSGLLVVDAELPDGAASSIVEILEMHTNRIPAVLCLSSRSRSTVLRRFLALPISDFLQKPFGGSELVSRAKNLLQMQSMRRWIWNENNAVRSRVAARTAELREAQDEVLNRLAWAAEFRDDLTGFHAERVGLTAAVIAKELGWDAEERSILERAAPLHDIGKISIPDSILRKPDKLTPSEMEVMRGHTTTGADLLSGSRNPIVQAAEEIARSHHERWDGEGYPHGLAGEEIPIRGRIVAVADAFDSLTNHRPYRNGVAPQEALRHIEDQAGTQFDPVVVEAFYRVVHSGELEEALNPDVVARPGNP